MMYYENVKMKLIICIPIKKFYLKLKIKGYINILIYQSINKKKLELLQASLNTLFLHYTFNNLI